MTTYKEATSKWAQALIKLNDLENEYDATWFWQPKRRSEILEQIKAVSHECKMCRDEVRAQEAAGGTR